MREQTTTIVVCEHIEEADSERLKGHASTSCLPDVRDAQHNLAHARTLDIEARAQVFTTAAALALSTGDPAPPEPADTH